MPQLKEWLLHFPRDWTPPQATEYIRDTTMMLVNSALPIMQAVGPDRASAMFLTVILNMARANPVYHENIKDAMARTYDAVEQLDPFKGAEAKT